MERVGSVVDGQVVRHAVERERAFGDTVRVATDDGAEIGALLDVVGEAREAEGDIGHAAVPIRHRDGLDDPAVGHDLDVHAAGVGQCIEVDRLAAHGAEGLLRDGRRRRWWATRGRYSHAGHGGNHRQNGSRGEYRSHADPLRSRENSAHNLPLLLGSRWPEAMASPRHWTPRRKRRPNVVSPPLFP